MEFIVVTNFVSKNLTLVFISIDFRAFFLTLLEFHVNEN